MDLPLANEHRAKVEAFQLRHRTAVLTLLFTDMLGSARLKQELGDLRAVALIEQHEALFRQLLAAFPDAEEVDKTGDSYFAIFARPSDAVRFALLLQSRLRRLGEEHGHAVMDRVGIHVGEVLVRSDANRRYLYGTQVDATARVMSLAEGGQILLTRAAFDNARPVLQGADLEGISGLCWLNHGPYLLKGMDEPVEICEVGEADKALFKPPADSEKVRRYISPDAEPVLGWRPALGQAVPNTQWVLELKLGEGSFGEVWLGFHHTLKEKRVFKFCFRADRARSLKREVTLLRLLKERVGQHPNIVGVQDVFFDQPPYYLIMDYTEGKDLRAWCEERDGPQKVPLAMRLEIVAQIADALSAAHRAGVIHRDLKPSNILVGGSSAPTARLTDFGIGQIAVQEALAETNRRGFTQTIFASGSSGQLGSQMYVAPELLAGKAASPRSDIYSLGVVLYQLLLGDFNQPITTDWARRIDDPLLREDLGKCFAGDPEERFSRAEELAAALRALEQRRSERQQTLEPADQPGAMIGRYRILEKIGEGGFGVVYFAEQREPVRRRVALKIIKLGMDTKQVIARFDAERQALALMDHPNIAKVLDAGATETGRPYFVMELVRGVPITDYCDQNNLDTQERLELFNQVCKAIHHAHQKGIIHRDIKPSNILVTLHDGVPVPKVIDFGIAKATQQELAAQTLFTQFGHFLGTPTYVSPEQAEMSGLDVDTRSDIYSLGVLLYELLTGTTPFDPKELVAAGFDEMRRTIREKEPLRPSTRLGTLLAAELTTTAKRRRVDAPKLVRLISGDLDWIVMKCLEKDRTRRYETALSFAADLERFLNDEPVNARPPSAAYRLRKMVRRYKGAVAAATAVTLALVLGLVASTWMYSRERKARLQSQRETLFFKSMLEGIKPTVALGRDTQLLREVLDKTVQQVVIELKDDPQVEAELCQTIGEVYRSIGQPDLAERIYRLALTLRGAPASSKRGLTAKLLDDLAMALKDQARLPEAESLEREALRLRSEAFGPESVEAARSLNNLGTVLRMEARLPEAVALHRQALAIQKKLFPQGYVGIAPPLIDLALALREAGQYSEAETNLLEALAIQKKFLGENDPIVALTLDNLAFVMLDRGSLSQAEQLERQALEMLRLHFGGNNPNDPNLATGINNMGLILNEQDRPRDAEAYFQQALEMRRKIPRHDLDVAASLDNLAVALRQQKQFSQAEPLVREALELQKNLLGDDHPAVAASLNDLASVLQGEGHWTDAEKHYRDALTIQRRRYGLEHPQVATTLNNLALLLLDQGRFAQAEQTMREALAMREKLLGAQHPAVARSRKALQDIERAHPPTQTQAAEATGSPKL
jgi:serine/threonine protein kinase/class 3 adenylate cyclase/tetratricopeptide (TPR) repeat protein